MGGIIARIMAAETSPENLFAVSLMGLTRSDRVLEVGFGHGRTVGHLAALVSEGWVAGIDPSQRMLKMATKYNRKSIADGRVELALGDCRKIPYPDASFDKVLAVHTIYFWDEPLKHLRELKRVMRPGARLVLGFRPLDNEVVSQFPAEVYRFYPVEEVARLCIGAGLVDTHVDERRFGMRNMAFLRCQRPDVMNPGRGSVEGRSNDQGTAFLKA